MHLVIGKAARGGPLQVFVETLTLLLFRVLEGSAQPKKPLRCLRSGRGGG